MKVPFAIRTQVRGLGHCAVTGILVGLLATQTFAQSAPATTNLSGATTLETTSAAPDSLPLISTDATTPDVNALPEAPDSDRNLQLRCTGEPRPDGRTGRSEQCGVELVDHREEAQGSARIHRSGHCRRRSRWFWSLCLLDQNDEHQRTRYAWNHVPGAGRSGSGPRVLFRVQIGPLERTAADRFRGFSLPATTLFLPLACVADTPHRESYHVARSPPDSACPARNRAW